MTAPFITCLCPTWCRPDLLQTAVACWADQQYPHDRMALLIGDDDDTPFKRWNSSTFRQQLPPDRQNVVYAHFAPSNSLPAKYNRMAEMALFFWPETEILAVWEDDDLYLPHHLLAIGLAAPVDRCVEDQWWAHPRTVCSDYRLGGVTQYYEQIPCEPSGGRFHAALALSVGLWRACPWIQTEAANFDQQYIAALGNRHKPREPLAKWVPNGADIREYRCTPSYVFRWHTQHVHGQNAMDSPSSMTWRRQAREMMRRQHAQSGRDESFQIQYDERALWLLEIARRQALRIA